MSSYDMSAPWNQGVIGTQVLPLINDDAPVIRVEAGPGTGKTYGLVRRVQRILHPQGLGVKGERVAVVAFNRVIAKKLGEDVEKMLKTSLHSGAPVIRTVHGFCLQVIGGDIRILLPHERDAMLYDLLHEHPALHADYPKKKDIEQALHDHEANRIPNPRLWQATQRWLVRHRARLISDLPTLLSDRMKGGDFSQLQFDHVVVDEFQDLTAGEPKAEDVGGESRSRRRREQQGRAGVMRVQSFTEIQLRRIANLLEGAVTHKELTSVFRDCGLAENRTVESGNPKWQRIVATLGDRQAQDGCGNNVGAFIQAVLNPFRFTGRRELFDDLRHRLNEILAFLGLGVGEDGKLRPVQEARTLSEAAERAGRLRKSLNDRRVHPDVLKFCREELLQDNYFHAVFEATKSVADKIREKSELATDGAELVDSAFSVRNPLLAINTLQSETEQSEQRGFANLLNGVFGTFRNVTAHAPKIKWPIEEQDALDLPTMVSYLHRRLDRTVKVPRAPSGHGG